MKRLLIFTTLLSIFGFGVFSVVRATSRATQDAVSYKTKMESSGVEKRVDNLNSPKPSQTAIPSPVVVKDSNPVVLCNYSHVEKIYLKASDCQKSVECNIGDSWYAYPDKDSCVSDQQKWLDGEIAKVSAARQRFMNKVVPTDEPSHYTAYPVPTYVPTVIKPQNPTISVPNGYAPPKSNNGYCVRPGIWADNEGMHQVGSGTCP